MTVVQRCLLLFLLQSSCMTPYQKVTIPHIYNNVKLNYYAVLWPERNSVLSMLFCEDHLVDLHFCSRNHYDITILGNDVVRDILCFITMSHDIVMGAYHGLTMHTDVARTLIYYVLLCPIMIFLFS